MKTHTTKEVNELLDGLVDFCTDNYGTIRETTQRYVDEYKKDNGLLPTLEVGKWYKTDKDKDHIFHVTKLDDNNYYYYGINVMKEWVNDEWYVLDSGTGEVFTEATHEEVEQALTAEAKKRGFKKGVRYIGMLTPTEESCGISKFSLHKNTTNEYLTDGCGGSVYANGKWATIIEDKKEMNTDFLKVTVSSSEVLVSFTVDELKKLKELVKIVK